MFLENDGRYQLLCRYHKTKDDELSIRIWRVPAELQLTEDSRRGVFELLKPTVVLKEEDIFLVDETFDLEDESVAGPWEHLHDFPVRPFDSDEI